LYALQETSADSFDADFQFMKEAGYDYVLHTKFRFRTATFYRRSKFALINEKHGDRTLTTLLSMRKDRPEGVGGGGGEEGGGSVFVVNCHLTGGPNPDKRLRQVHDASEYIRKEMNKMLAAKSKPDAALAVVYCGDFNDEGCNAVKKLLCEGTVPAQHMTQDGVVVTSKNKKQEIGKFIDAHELAYGAAARDRPATIICPNLDSHMVHENGELTPKLREALRSCFNDLTGHKDSMSQEAMEEWLVRINGQLGRGSEFRSANAILEQKRAADEEPVLSYDDFVQVYRSEIGEGKFWGVHHDLQVW
jgi:hypothetical protein